MEKNKLNFSNFIEEKKSYKDPHGKVFYFQNRIFRSVNNNFKEDYEYIKKENIYKRLIEEKKLINTWEIDIKFESNEIYKIIEHEKISLDTKPYEWTFYKLKKAALFHLDLHIYLLNLGYTLKDSSAFNVKFINNEPIFIDFLSITKYKQKDYWNGYDQFCKEFYNPLLLCSKYNLGFNNVYKGFDDGIPTTFTYKLLGFKTYLSFFDLIHVFFKSYLEIKNLKKNNIKKKFNLTSYIFLLNSFKNKIKNLDYNPRYSFWSKYYDNCNYKDTSENEKISIFKSFIYKNNINKLLDLGCNTGKYSIIASEMNVKQIISIDNDVSSLEILEKKKKKNIFTIYKNLIEEIQNHNSLNQSYTCDGVIAFALLHHLHISENLPLKNILKYIIENSNNGLIEFVSSEDQMVKSMIEIRDKKYPDYNLKDIKQIISKYCNILKVHKLNSSERYIIEYRKD